MEIALATSADLPDLDPDERLLVPALASRGLSAAPVVWQDDAFDWSGVRACVIRSTWGYYLERARFLAWTERVARATRLFNPPDVVRWNTHKGYLAELEARGIATVPTVGVARGEAIDLEALARARGWREIVVKPAVSAGAYATVRAGDAPGALASAQRQLDAIVAGGDAMVQPYLSSVESIGELSIVFFDGEPSHAIRKHPQLGPDGPRDGGEPPARVGDEELAFARRVLAAAPFAPSALLYARVDVARDDRGALALMELEVTEPSLFLAQGDAAARFAEAIARRVR